MNKRIQKAEFKLPFMTRLALVFNLPPKGLYESRYVFENALGLFEVRHSPIRIWFKRKIKGRVVMYSNVWLRTFKAWVLACDVKKEELKGAFFSAIKYNFFSGGDKVDNTGDSPLLQAVVEAWLAVLEPNLHVDDHETLWDLACGNWMNCPHSKWQQAALIMWLEASSDCREDYNRGIGLCRPGTEPYNRFVAGKPNDGFI